MLYISSLMLSSVHFINIEASEGCQEASELWAVFSVHRSYGCGFCYSGSVAEFTLKLFLSQVYKVRMKWWHAQWSQKSCSFVLRIYAGYKVEVYLAFLHLSMLLLHNPPSYLCEWHGLYFILFHFLVAFSTRQKGNSPFLHPWSTVIISVGPWPLCSETCCESWNWTAQPWGSKT